MYSQFCLYFGHLARYFIPNNSEITRDFAYLAMAELLGTTKERLPRLLAQARNDRTTGHFRSSRNDGSQKGGLALHVAKGPPVLPFVIAKRSAFCSDMAICIPKIFHPPMSLRGGTPFVSTWQSPVPKAYWEHEKRDCFGLSEASQ